MSYVISAAASTNLREHLNHQVRITGASAVAAQPGGESAPRPSAGQSGQSSSDRPSAGQSSPSSGMGQVAKVEEKDMPKLTARTIAKVADTCVAAVPAAD